MKKQLKTAEEMAAEFHNSSNGKGLSSQELSKLLADIIREGGYDPGDQVVRADIQTAHRRSAA